MCYSMCYGGVLCGRAVYFALGWVLCVRVVTDYQSHKLIALEFQHNTDINFFYSYDKYKQIIPTSVTPNLQPGYDRIILESLSNRRENVQLIVVVVGDRTSKISRNKVDGHVQNCLT